MPIDRKLGSGRTETDVERVDVTRRKLLWVAPAIMSRRLIYASSGCGKGDPFVTACQQHPAGGS